MAKLNKTPLTIRAKRGTEAEITSYTGYQLSGEIAYATDTEAFFVSNGTTFVAVGGSSETPTLQSVTDAGNTTTNDINTSGAINLSSGGYIYGDSTNPYLKLNTAQGALLGYGSSYLNNGGSLLFHAGGSTRFYVGSSGSSYFTGYLGIGTTSPTEKLHVVGNAKIQGDIYLNDAMERYIYGYNNQSYIKFYDPSYGGMLLHTNPNHRVLVETNLLEVTGDFRTGGGFTMFGDLAIGNGNRVESSVGNNGITLYRSSDASMVFQIKHPTVGHYIYQDKDGNELMRLTRDGNIGIGTTAPISPLHIGNGGNLTLESITSVDGKLSFKAANGSEHAYLKRSGSYNLEIYSYGDIKLGSGTSSINFANNGKPINWNVYNNSNFIFSGYTGFGGEVIMNNRADGTEVFHAYLAGTYKTTFPNGNVGVGTTSPTEKLEVAGNILVSGEVKTDVITSPNAYLTIGSNQQNHTVRFGAVGRTPITIDLSVAPHNSLYFDGGGPVVRALKSDGDVKVFGSLYTDGNLVAGLDNNTSGWTSVPIRPGYPTGNANNAAGLDLVIQGGQGTGSGIGGSILFKVKSANGAGTQDLSVLDTAMTIEQGTRNVIISKSASGAESNSNALKLSYEDSTAVDGDLSITANPTGTSTNFVVTDTRNGELFRVNTNRIEWSGGDAQISRTNTASPYNFYGGSDINLYTGSTAWASITTESKPLYLGTTDKFSANLVIDTAGNVGIGTTAPLTKLHVVGNLFLGLYNRIDSGHNNTTKNSIQLYDGSTGDLNITLANTSWYLRHNANMSIDGNVGIGTTAPTEKLEVAEETSLVSTTSTITSTTHTSTGTTTAGFGSNVDFKLQQPVSGNIVTANRIISKWNSTSQSGEYTISSFYSSISGAAGSIYNVASFGVQPTTGLPGIITLHDTPTSFSKIKSENGRLRVDVGSNGALHLGNFDAVKRVSNSTLISGFSGVLFSGDNNASEHMRITSAGNVGIGTTAPAAPLHVNGSLIAGTSTTSGLYFNAAADRLHISNQRVLEKSGANIYLGYNATNLIFRTNNLERARFDLNGNLGIGTTAPTSKTHINGTAMSQLRLEQQGGPLTNADTKGQVGDIAYDDLYFYIKTTNGWGRVPLDFGF